MNCMCLTDYVKRSCTPKVLLCLIFILALALRLHSLGGITQSDDILRGDAAEFHELALSLLDGKGFSWREHRAQIASFIPIETHPGQPTSWREPAYPFFIASIYFIFGQNITAVRVIQAIVGAFLCLIVYAIGTEVFNRRSGLIAAFLTAIYPTFISYLYFGGPKHILSENLFIVILAVNILMYVRLIKNPSSANLCFSGIFSGAAVLTRSTALFFPVLFGCVYLIANKDKMCQKVTRIMILLACFILILIPWSIRNYLVHNEFILVTTRGGVGFRAGNNSLSRGGFTPNLKSDHLKGLSENKVSKGMFKDGVDFLRTNKSRIPKLFLRKIIAFWNPYGVRYNIQFGICAPFLIIGLLAAMKSGSRNNTYLVLVLLLAYFTFITMIFLGDIRFRYPVEPYLLIFAGRGMDGMLNKLKSNKVFPVAFTLAVLVINIVLYVHSDVLLLSLRQLFKKLSLG